MERRQLPLLLQEKARMEVNEDPNKIDSDILHLREWLKKQPHLQSVQPKDQWLLSFLRGNKYSLEKTKYKLDMYYTLRTVVPEIFQNRNPFDPAIQELLKSGIFLPLTNLASEDSRRVSIQRFECFDGSKSRLIDLFKLTYMIIEILILEDDNFVIAGEDVLVDMTGFGISTISQWTPALAKKTVTIIEKALPVRLKSLHILHTSTGFETVYSLLRMFLSEKLNKRCHIYSEDFDAMFDVIPRSILPKEYGGESGTIQELTDYWKNKVESYSDWYLNEEQVCSDETLRPGPPRTTSDLFGVEGSFRKLEVD